MKKSGFLNELMKEGKIQLIEPSEEMSKSYFEKSKNSMKSAKILLKNNLYENSISMSYYSMYNCLLALFFMVGIKSKTHTGSILLFKKLLDANPNLRKILAPPFLIVDEYQDLNRCDQTVIKYLYEGGSNLVIAGDDDQSIFEFRKANPKGIRNFGEIAPDSL